MIDSPVLLAVPHLFRSRQAALDVRKSVSDFGVLVMQDVPVLASCTDQEPKRREDFEERGGRLHTMYAPHVDPRPPPASQQRPAGVASAAGWKRGMTCSKVDEIKSAIFNRFGS